jgi:hypothetical protein
MDFLRESNRIEGIPIGPTKSQVIAAKNFLWLSRLTCEDMEAIVHAFQPDARLRVNGEIVRVGNHWPPPGSMAIKYELERLLGIVNGSGEGMSSDPYKTHHKG